MTTPLLLALLAGCLSTATLDAAAHTTPGAVAPAIHGQDNGEKGQDTDGSDQVPKVELAELPFSDAKSRAERLEKMLVVLWTREGDPKSELLQTRIFGDPEVRRWMHENAVAAQVDVDKYELDARRNRIGVLQVPCIDIFSLTRGGRLDRLVHGSQAIDFLAAVFTPAEGDEVQRPSGDTANEPFRWLAWANHCYRTPGLQSGFEAVWAYRWCLNTADGMRPGFRARYFEFLVRRLIQCKPRSAEAVEAVQQEFNRIARQLEDGKASQRDAYEFRRLATWLESDETLRKTVARISAKGEARRRELIQLLPVSAPILGRHGEYEPILAAVGNDAKDIFLARAEAIRRAATGPETATDGTAVPESVKRFIEPPLEHTVSDTRADLLEDASWVFEALLHAERAKEAMEFHGSLAGLYPSAPRAYALFMERAIRVGRGDLAAAIGDAGIASLDERGIKRIQRILGRIPADTDK